jgi:signal transduction histidine kinase
MKDGHGLKNISGRLSKIDGRCTMESLSGVGTKVSISLPLPNTKESASVPSPH